MFGLSGICVGEQTELPKSFTSKESAAQYRRGGKKGKKKRNHNNFSAMCIHQILFFSCPWYVLNISFLFLTVQRCEWTWAAVFCVISYSLTLAFPQNTRREVSLVLSWSVFWHYCTGGSISRCQDDNTESIHSRLRSLSFQISRAALHLQQNSCHITSLDYVWLTRNGICMNS